MEKYSIRLIVIAMIVFASLSIFTLALGQDKFSVSGEITYWQQGQQEGLIMAWLMKQEERKKYYELVPQARTLKIKLSPQEGQDSKLMSKTVTFKFVDVSKGTYGIFCILDKNKNGKMDYPEGITPGKAPPIEPYAYSGPKSFGPAPWENFAINVEKDVSGIKIKLPLK